MRYENLRGFVFLNRSKGCEWRAIYTDASQTHLQHKEWACKCSCGAAAIFSSSQLVAQRAGCHKAMNAAVEASNQRIGAKHGQGQEG